MVLPCLAEPTQKEGRRDRTERCRGDVAGIEGAAQEVVLERARCGAGAEGAPQGLGQRFTHLRMLARLEQQIDGEPERAGAEFRSSPWCEQRSGEQAERQRVHEARQPAAE